MTKLHLFKESFIATVVIITITYLISFFPWSLEYGKALHQGFADFDIYDLYYSGRHQQTAQRDTNIILVQIGNTRDEIAQQIDLINNYNPKVIGIDAFFERRSENDSALQKTIASYLNLVFINRYTADGFVANIFNNKPDRCGFGNFFGQEYSVIRTFIPSLKVDDTDYNSFTSCIIKLANKKSYDVLQQRNNNAELINYKGNLEFYTSFTADELLEYHFSNQLEKILNNKIVLLGYFTKDTSAMVLNDLHYTPMNEIVSGKSFPDTYGVVIHANILSMIISGKYPVDASKAVSYLFAFVLTFFYYYYMISRYNRKAHPSHTVFLLVQIFSILFILYFFLKLYDWFLFKVTLEPIMISMVLSLEFFGIHQALAEWLKRKYHYKTVFKPVH